MKLPNEIGPVHFVGIGGIGMSGIAEVLINLGHDVQGSDASDNANVKRLREHGARVFVGHDAANLGAAAVVVVSTAIKRDNPELVAARARRIPVVRRAEMLAELMRLKQCVAVAGTHGKTTTTSLVATLLDAAGLDPTVINGGIINAYGTNARLGAGDWMVVEADESDGTFLKLPADVAIVTNIDPEHLDHFKTFDAIKEAFLALIENLPFYGFAVMCLDHPTVQELVGRIEDRRVITYGENPQADVRLMDVDLAGGRDPVFRADSRARRPAARPLSMNWPCRCPAGTMRSTPRRRSPSRMRLALSVDVIRKAIGGFGGVKRRFTSTGDWNGVAIFDDYGHHPVEIAAVLKAARASTSGKVIAVVQPHRYTRLASLFDAFATCFNDADSVIVADVYPAGEAPIEGADKTALAAAIAAHGHRHALALPSPEKLAPMVRSLAEPGDYRRLVSAPARSPNGPMRCPANSPRSTGPEAARPHELSGHRRRPEGARAAICAGASSPTLRSPRRHGSGSAGRRRFCSRPPTRTISPMP